MVVEIVNQTEDHSVWSKIRESIDESERHLDKTYINCSKVTPGEKLTVCLCDLRGGAISSLAWPLRGLPPKTGTGSLRLRVCADKNIPGSFRQ